MLITTVVLQKAPPGLFDHAGKGRGDVGRGGDRGGVVELTPLRLSQLI